MNAARRLAQELAESGQRSVFVDQFENLSNYESHLQSTGPEIWTQLQDMNQGVDCFVMSSGTGGTIAGVSTFLKSCNKDVKIVLADPNGSSLLNWVNHGVCYTAQQSEKTIKKHRYDSVVEGVGLDRLTANFKKASIDQAYMIPDQEIVLAAQWLLYHEGE